MPRKIRKFFRHYKQLGFVILTFVFGLVLDLVKQHTAAHWVLGVSASINVIPLLWGMWEDVRSGAYGIDILAATAIITSVILKEYWAGMVIVLMLTGGEALEDYAERRAKVELSDLLQKRPKQAHLLKNGKTTDITAAKIQANDKIVVLPGEVVPVDGIIIEGGSSFDESSLTGESLPVIKQSGDEVLSGSVNIEGSITIKALHSAADSQYEQIIKLVRGAANSQAPFVRLADRYSIPFTVVAFILAGSVWFASGHAIRFLEVLVVATPCPLLLGAPIALISGMSRAAKQGIIVKTGSSLERLAEIRTIAFDKTGTLTLGSPNVSKVVSYAEFTQDEVLAYAAALEQNSSHILARSIVQAAQAKKIKIPKAKHIKELSGSGLEGRLNNKDVVIGRLNLLRDKKISLPKSFKETGVTQTASFVAINGRLAGTITFADTVRPDARKMLQRLKKAGIKHTVMITGDNPLTAKAVAKQVGIERVEADCLPAEKIHKLEALKDRPVAFVGDGVNDAPVLTAADVGIALGARGSTAASESADVVIMLDDVSRVADSVEIAKRTFFIAKQSILAGIFLSIGLMGIFATGRFRAVQGAAIQEIVDITVIVNALRAHSSGRRFTKRT